MNIFIIKFKYAQKDRILFVMVKLGIQIPNTPSLWRKRPLNRIDILNVNRFWAQANGNNIEKKTRPHEKERMISKPVKSGGTMFQLENGWNMDMDGPGCYGESNGRTSTKYTT